MIRGTVWKNTEGVKSKTIALTVTKITSKTLDGGKKKEKEKINQFSAFKKFSYPSQEKKEREGMRSGSAGMLDRP